MYIFFYLALKATKFERNRTHPGQSNHSHIDSRQYRFLRRSNDSSTIVDKKKRTNERTRAQCSCRASHTRNETTNFRGRRRPRRRPNGPSDSSLRSNLAGRGWNGTETANKRTVARNDTVFALAGWISCRRNLSRKLSNRGLIISLPIKSRCYTDC